MSMRLLEQHRVPYQALTYADTLHDGVSVAHALDLPLPTVFKTLVAQPEGAPKPCLAVIPVAATLDLKKLAVALGVKKARMAALKDAEALTGLKVGGISALALTAKAWPVLLDASATAHVHIVMSGGQRGIQLRVPTQAFVTLAKARLAMLVAEDTPTPSTEWC